MKQVGILVGGADCPGVNAVIRGVVTRLTREGVAVQGIAEGWRGILTHQVSRLDVDRVREILPTGGSLLGTSHTNPRKHPGALQELADRLAQLELDALVVIGGEDTLGVAADLFKTYGTPIIGIPKSIDNDLAGTDVTFGFDSAAQVAADAIDRLRTTAETHRRVMVVETMGRTAGWIAARAGITAGADAVLIPERAFRIDQVVETIMGNRRRGKLYNIVVCAEAAWMDGIERGDRDAIIQLVEEPVRRRRLQQFLQYAELEGTDEFGRSMTSGFISKVVAELLAERTGYEVRELVLGHLQRGGHPTAFDRFLGVQYAVAAADLLLQQQWGRMAAWRDGHMTSVSITDAIGEPKYVDDQTLALVDLLCPGTAEPAEANDR